uniref:Uncharacterized protein n=1 Tax=Cannabis sativa TaxID=3483 RepID=A0A803QDS3_CANSA
MAWFLARGCPPASYLFLVLEIAYSCHMVCLERPVHLQKIPYHVLTCPDSSLIELPYKFSGLSTAAVQFILVGLQGGCLAIHPSQKFASLLRECITYINTYFFLSCLSDLTYSFSEPNQLSIIPKVQARQPSLVGQASMVRQTSLVGQPSLAGQLWSGQCLKTCLVLTLEAAWSVPVCRTYSYEFILAGLETQSSVYCSRILDRADGFIKLEEATKKVGGVDPSLIAHYFAYPPPQSQIDTYQEDEASTSSTSTESGIKGIDEDVSVSLMIIVSKEVTLRSPNDKRENLMLSWKH